MTLQEFNAKFINPWLDKLAISPNNVRPIVAFVFGYKIAALDNRGGGDGWQVGRLWFGRVSNEKLFYNGVLMVRVMLPFYVGIHIRWAGKEPTHREYFQFYLGWKLNGFLSAAFRFQSDKSAADGFTSPNPNQAIGWFDGAK